MNKQDMLKLIKSIISSNEDITTLIPLEEVALEHRLAEDLGLDSMSLMSLVYELQETFESLDESGISRWSRVSDLIASIETS